MSSKQTFCCKNSSSKNGGEKGIKYALHTTCVEGVFLFSKTLRDLDF